MLELDGDLMCLRKNVKQGLFLLVGAVLEGGQLRQRQLPDVGAGLAVDIDWLAKGLLVGFHEGLSPNGAEERVFTR